MRHLGTGFLAILCSCSASLLSQSTPPATPQTARQALIEMFLGKGADDFTKHLPDDARKTLIHKGDTPEVSVALKISAFSHELIAQGGHVETFDSGPNILVSEQPDHHEKIEVAVEHDNLMGEEDEIELSVHSFKDGMPEMLPVIPRLTFTLKQEKEIWRLTEITLAAHVPLTDPDYLAGLRKQQNDSNESSARWRMFTIAQAETSYAGKHPEAGYNCSLADLFAQSEEQAGPVMSEDSNGYHFALSGCRGTPATTFRLTAVPTETDSDMKTFCADESGKIRFLPGGSKSNCFKWGESIPTTSGASITPD